MVAADYFDQRSRLGAALFSLGQTADLAGLKPSRAPVVKALVEGLRDPFVFVVAGEVNAGKSTLLNALFGEEFCRWGVLPETSRIHYFRYGKSPRRTARGPLLDEVELPHAFLRDFHVVDTPGVNSTVEGHESITREFMPRADAVLFCFPATNPWSGAAWDFLGRVQQDGLRNIVLVLQQADLRTPPEVEAIAEHMRSIARQRLGVELPVFPVSARLALLARTSGLDKPRLLADSEFPAFEQQLTRMVAGAAPRLAKLVTACSAGQGMLAEIQSKLAAGAAALAELTLLQEEVGKAVAEAAVAAAEAGEEVTRSVRQTWAVITTGAISAALAERLTFPALLLGREATAATIESRLLPPLLAEVRVVATEFESGLDLLIGGLWKQSGSAIHRALEGRVRRPPEPEWPSRTGLFLPSMENAVCEAVCTSGLAGVWQERVKRRQGMMRGLSLLVLLAAGTVLAGVISQALPPAALAWLGMGVVGAGLAGRSFLRRETQETTELAAPLCAAAADQLTTAARRLAETHGRQRIEDFRSIITPLETAIRHTRQTAAPLEEAADQLAVTFHSLARSLR